ncbi:MAG: hypothetical protein L0228_19330 [Planctomycetes bacterium]|nr:hypothetical protein [Planctomycetota bacterium]
MFRHWLHFNRRLGCVAAILVLLISAGGCASWNLDRFSLNRLRDDRAVDIDNRLEGSKPIVANPF